MGEAKRWERRLQKHNPLSRGKHHLSVLEAQSTGKLHKH